MIKKLLLFTLTCILTGLYSCASQYPMLAQQATVKSDKLKKHCKLQELNSKISMQADSLYSVSRRLIENGQEEQGYFLMETASVMYKYAISRNEVEKSNEEIKRLEQLLVKAKDKLDTYKKVLSEIESRNK